MRGRIEVPIWVLVLMMTACLAVAIWALARDQVTTWIGF